MTVTVEVGISGVAGTPAVGKGVAVTVRVIIGLRVAVTVTNSVASSSRVSVGLFAFGTSVCSALLRSLQLTDATEMIEENSISTTNILVNKRRYVT